MMRIAVAAALLGCGTAPPPPVAAEPTPPTVPAPRGALSLDSARSKIEFLGTKLVGKHAGGFTAFSGSAELADGRAEGGSVAVVIDMTSVFSDDDRLTDHLKNEDFFDVVNHPTAKFVSTEISSANRVTGDLTLRGKTKPIAFDAKIDVREASVVVEADLEINRKDFGLVYDGKADNLINDEVQVYLALTFE